jgi:sugar transferase (PEP-CTERM system associated)
MVRLFSVYYPTRTVVLVGAEAILVCTSFLLGCLVHLGQDTYLVLNYEHGFAKILGITGLALLCLYYNDLYDLQRLRIPAETYVRLLMVLGIFSLALAALSYFFPGLVVGRGVYVTGLAILTFVLLGWRWTFGWLLRLPIFQEKVCVLGAGPRASRLVEILRANPSMGMDVVGWIGALGEDTLTREVLADQLNSILEKRNVDRVIVALSDRRGTMPVRELLALRMHNVKVEEATAVLERVSGKIDVDQLRPSWLIFSDGFRMSAGLMTARRVLFVLLSFVLLLVVLPLLPLITLLVRLTSPGPVLYRQKRVGRNGVVFHCYKFRTMWADAEADTGPTWAGDDDPRITPVGRWLRRMRLDELPQLWNVLRGDMNFVGPRPERPEFVDKLIYEISYYQIRHIVRPGITGWAQINYPYGASVEDAKEKLRYDLYYIKNMSMALEIFIVFQTIKIVLLGRGAK